MSRQAAVVPVLALAGLTSSFMYTTVVPIQAELPRLLAASRDDTAWVVTATLLAAAVATPVAGRLGDLYGKRRVMLALAAMLVLGSVVAALSVGVVWLVIGRALQGLVTGVVPLGISIARDVVAESRIASATATISATLGVGGAVGLPVSALIAMSGNWRLVFWMAGALGIAVFVLVLLVVPRGLPGAGGRFDAVGAFGLAVGLSGVLVAISRGNVWGWITVPTLACGLGGVLALVVWAIYELRVRQPLINVRLAARPRVLFVNLASVAVGFALFSSSVSLPQILQLPESTGVGLGLSLLAASLVVMPSGLIMMALSPLSGWLSIRVGARTLLIVGELALVLAYAGILVSPIDVWHVLAANVMIGVGVGFGYAAMPLLVMRAVPRAETGASNGLNALFRSLGTSMAATVVGAVLATFVAPHAGGASPTVEAFRIVFALGAGAGIVALALTLLVPRR